MCDSKIRISKTTKVVFVYENQSFSGVRKISEKVMEDIRLVTDAEVVMVSREDYDSISDENQEADKVFVLYGTIGKSPLLQKLSDKGAVSFESIKGKREVYGFFPITIDERKCIVIAGSDKRGTIYGLFHISDILGVSPLVNWSLAIPAKKEIEISFEDTFISKEPSVVYRGFFINDEWPAFGNWCTKRFGGFTAEAYEGIFELLLRMKGNYLWPAMWSSCFAEDGPGLASAVLADELGVVMGLSHHEPCLRHGEEYSHVRGKDSIYGDAWDFRSNKEGITRFWRDGLKRNGHLENVITVGMRGERDSMILGEKATLKDNIELIKDVLKTQNQLIAEEVNPHLEEVPRMIALYKEVEAYYYGDEKTEGLKKTEDLENLILMLTDDNHGYVRSLPDEDMRKHKGGFGMYYHFDYHGEPISYEWINCTYLPEVWEEMCSAYEKGVRDLWIVNVGDLGLQEMPLSYFLDLAYDYDKWGISAQDKTMDYLKLWMKKQFGGAFSDEELDTLADIYNRYTRLVHNRRPEHLNDKVYHPQNYYEAVKVLKEAEEIERICKEYEDKCPAEYKDAYTELMSYNILAGMNLIKLWIYRSLNHYYASIGSCAANKYAELMREALKKDSELKDKLHSAASGKWYGFGLGEHIGFKHWNSEESSNPVIEEIIPKEGSGLMVGLVGETGATSGQEWTKETLYIRQFYDGNALSEKQRAQIFVTATGDKETEYRVEVSSEALSVDKSSGVVSQDNPLEYITIEVDKTRLTGADETLSISVVYAGGKADIEIIPDSIDASVIEQVSAYKEDKHLENVCIESDGIAVLDASHFSSQKDTPDEQFRIVRALGRKEDAVKLYKSKSRSGDDTYASLDYTFYISESGEYDITFQLLPTHAYEFGKPVRLSFSVNKEEPKNVDIITEDLINGVHNSWSDGVLSHVRLVTETVSLAKGINVIRFIGTAEENVLERILLVKKDSRLLESYLGPDESVVL
ncbi:MAG TPA: alpha-glucuronidase [Lachnospiraceae bacterium]|nr:alpha-glucuronidase [Lachnospiraceae bacterium]